MEKTNLDSLKPLLALLEPSLDNLNFILKQFNLNINELLNFFKQDNPSLLWLALLYSFLIFTTILDNINAYPEPSNLIDLPDFLLNVDKLALKDAIIPNYMKNLWMNDIIFNNDIRAYAIYSVPIQAPRSFLPSSFFLISHGLIREFSFLTDLSEARVAFNLQGDNNQAAADAYDALMANQENILTFDELRINIITNLPSSMYISLPFIPEDLHLSRTWNLRLWIQGQEIHYIEDVPNNMDELERIIRVLYEQVRRIEERRVLRFLDDTPGVIDSIHRRVLQALRYLEAIIRWYKPEYIATWESRLDNEFED